MVRSKSVLQLVTLGTVEPGLTIADEHTYTYRACDASDAQRSSRRLVRAAPLGHETTCAFRSLLSPYAAQTVKRCPGRRGGGGDGGGGGGGGERQVIETPPNIQSLPSQYNHEDVSVGQAALSSSMLTSHAMLAV